jgi:hypothetical protein
VSKESEVDIMNLNYAIFRSEPIMTINDLAQIGSHNKREKKAYNSNPDIDIERSKDNIELVPLSDKYVKGFYNLVKDYRKEHEERQKNEREDRKKTFKQMLDKSNNVVADELLFTATNEFFKDMTKEDIIDWANTCMEFVYEDLGYTKDQVLHSVVHLDEKTPHIHCVVVPLVKKFDKRTNTERFTISKKQYIKDKIHLSELQDKYHERLTSKGYDLERGIKGSDRKHIKIKDYKKINRKLEQNLNSRNDRLDKVMNEFEEQMKTTKTIPFDKKHIVVEKDTFDTMNKVIKESKKVMELQPKINEVFNEVDNYVASYNSLEKDNQKYQREIKSLKTRNSNLLQENNKLKSYIDNILEVIKKFFRKLLQIGNEPTKEATTNEIKEYYDNQDFNSEDVYDISKETTKEDELFDYADIPSYLKTDNKSYETKDKDDFEMTL